ncbi:MAG TPA: IPT/TIG domain-containing protein [Candidatus Acidoferrum sp.]|nr:IPT/TIG domain-containing protein [Candidatus Acidoferrum sp.]
MAYPSSATSRLGRLQTSYRSAGSAHDRIAMRYSWRMVGRVPLIFAVLVLSHGALLATPQALPQTQPASTARLAKAPFPKLSISPDVVVADITGNSAQDVTLHYSIEGDLSKVDRAWVEIADGPRGKVVFTQPVPIQYAGEVIWPQGQPMDATPNDISFQVSNPDGGVSLEVEAQAEYPLPGDDPTPILSSITPRRVVKGSIGTSIVLLGRNFVPSAMVTFSRDGANNDAILKPRFISSHRLILPLPANLTVQEANWQVEVLENDVSNSYPPVPFRIVPPGLPPAPTLASISPSQFPSSREPADKWITLQGDNFQKGDTKVMTGSIPDELDAKFISAHRMRALIPAWWLSGPSRMKIHLESALDSDLASRTLPFTVLNTVGDVSPDPIPPVLNSVNDGHVVMPASREARPTTVRLLGSNFRPNAQVTATVDGEARALKTVFVSSHELRVVVPTDLWSLRFFVMTFFVHTKPEAPAASGKTLTAVVSPR